MISPRDLQKASVLGAGQMGSGIAQVLAASGLEVQLYDVANGALDKGIAGIDRSLRKLAEKKALSETPEAIVARIHPVRELAAIRETQFLIEAVVEKESVKVEMFQQLHKQLDPAVIFASNTSSISITRMGSGSGRPESFVGMHFMNPAPLMKLVEVVVGLRTSPETIAFVEGLAERLGKTHVRAQDYPGFIVNRILLPMINEAICALQDSIGTPEDIDTAMLQGTNQPMGPLALADLIGLDTVLSIMEVMHHTFGDDKYRPAPLLRRYVDAGQLGRKSGQGFYNYAKR